MNEDKKIIEGKPVTENKMGVMKINKLIIDMSLPLMISMLVQAMYNIVDSFFVAKISEDALTAVSLAFPVQQVMIALGTGTGVGVNAVLSKSLGEKKFERANQVARTYVVITFLTFLAVCVFGIFGVRPFFEAQKNSTISDAAINYGIEYLTIICTMSIGLFYQIGMERLMQSTGKTIYNMYTQLIGAVINIILDPIMIFGLLGFPRMEMMGAAVATVTAQWIAACCGVFFNVKFNKEINLNMKGFKMEMKIVKRIYKVGLPSIIMGSIGSVMVLGFNRILSVYQSAVAVFGVYFKVQSFVFMPVFGMNNGLIPITAYNYGARKPDRIKETMKWGMIYAMTIMVVGTIFFEIFPKQIMGIFAESKNTVAIGALALRIISIHFPLAALSIIKMSMLQALGEGFRSMMVSITRQLFAILPLAFIFSKIGGLDMVWWSFPLAEIVGFGMVTIFLRKTFNEKVYPLYETADN
ncbi:MAG: MATE family efflux transporter [Lachnospiraceae bacterium]|nr:MATE family efflux transporter [Lachnospiraceae bacterium]